MSAVTKQEIVDALLNPPGWLSAEELAARIEQHGIAPPDCVTQADEETHRRVDEAVRNGRIEDRRAGGEAVSAELIKRIDEKMSVICPYDEEGERTRDFDTWAILHDCRAALSRKYVPMTGKELYKIWLRADGGADGALLAVQSEIIRRAGLEVAGD